MTTIPPFGVPLGSASAAGIGPSVVVISIVSPMGETYLAGEGCCGADALAVGPATGGDALLVVLAAPEALLAVVAGVLAADLEHRAPGADGRSDRLAHLAGFSLLTVRSEEVLGLALAGTQLHPLLLDPTRK